MAMFFGSTPSENLEISREEFVSNVQDGQAALVACNQIQSEMRNLQQQMITLNNSMEDLKSRSYESKEKGSKKLPKRLLEIVKQVYGKSSSNFNSAELFGCQHNQTVATELLEKIMERYKKYDRKLIGRAIHRYYESRRRTYNDSQPQRLAAVAKNKERAKRKGYRTRLYRRRKNVATETEKIKWLEIDFKYMTSESEDENGVVRVHHLPWTSDELQSLKANLDQRLQERAMVTGRYVAKPREESTPSTLPMPPHPVKWAVNSTSQTQSSSPDGAGNSQSQSQSTPAANPSIFIPQLSVQSIQHRQNVTPLSVAANVLSSTTPDRYASTQSQRRHNLSRQHHRSGAGVNALQRNIQGDGRLYGVQGGSGVHRSRPLGLFNNTGQYGGVRHNCTRANDDRDREPISCSSRISPSEVLNEFVGSEFSSESDD